MGAIRENEPDLYGYLLGKQTRFNIDGRYIRASIMQQANVVLEVISANSLRLIGYLSTASGPSAGASDFLDPGSDRRRNPAWGRS